MRILQHFFPNRELNLQSLRTIVKAIENNSLATPPVQDTDSIFALDDASLDGGKRPQDTDAQDVDDLHGSLGCMMRDSRGKFRYVGNHSDIPFNGAVSTLENQRKNPAIIESPKVGSYPPSLLVSSPCPEVMAQEVYYLPPRPLCDLYVARYLQDVHCTYWLYPAEALLQRVEDTYLGTTQATSSKSWMCSLYAIFSIGASNRVDFNAYSPSSTSSAPLDAKTSEDYLILAKELVPAVHDEADLESIRALAILVSVFTTCILYS